MLCFTVAPVSSGVLLSFIIGAVLLILGMGLFTLGVDISMTPMGNEMGAAITRSRKMGIIILCCFLIGMLITISEPDLQVLAQQVASIPNQVLIFAVAAGVGIFMVVAVLRTLFQIKLNRLLIILYILCFVLACFVPKDFIAIAFDSGGVTTGPMTVPFIMAIGVGVAAIRSDRDVYKRQPLHQGQRHCWRWSKPCQLRQKRFGQSRGQLQPYCRSRRGPALALSRRLAGLA